MKNFSFLFSHSTSRPVWIGFILIAILAALTEFDVGRQSALWENIHWTLATWVMVWLGIIGWQNSTGRIRQIRGIFTAGMVSYAFGQLLWDIQWHLGVTAFPAVSDVFFLGIAPFFMAGLIWTIRNQVSRADEVAVYLDSGMILATLATGIFALYGPRASVLSGLSILVLVSYPVIFLAFAAAIFVAAVSLRARYEASSPYPLIAGLGFSGICWVIWNSIALDGLILPGTLTGYGFSLSHVCVGLGVALWDVRPSRHPKDEQRSRFILRTMPIIALPLAMMALVWGQIQTANLRLPIVAGGSLVIILAVIRQSLLVWERDNLLTREREALRQAETELAERQKTEEILLASEHLSRTLFATAQRQTQELALLDKIRTALAREVDLPAIYRMVVESIAETFGYTLVSLYRLEGEMLILQHQVGYEQVIREIHISQGVSGEVVRGGKPILIEDVRSRPDFLGAIEGIVSEVCVPLFDQGQVAGFINVESTQGVQLTEADLNLMSALSEQVGIAIERGRLYAHLQRQNQILAALHETTLTLMKRLELSGVLETIVAQAAQLADTEHGFLYLVEPEENRLKLEVGVGANAQHKGAYLSLGQGLAGKVWQTGAPLVVSDYHTWLGKASQFDAVPFQAIAGVPLISHEQIIGVFGVAQLEAGRGFEPDVVELLDRFAQFAAIALENARLYTQAQQELAERKRAEVETRTLLDIMRGAMGTPNLQEFLFLVHHSIGKVIYAENFFVALYNQASGLFEEVYSVDEYDSPLTPTALGKSASAYMFRLGKPLLLARQDFLDLIAQGELEFAGPISPSWLGVPLKTSERSIGVMVVQDYNQPNRYSAHDVEYLASIAGQVALAVERNQAEEALRQFRRVLDQSNDAIFLIDPETSQYIDFNQTALDYLQYSRDELMQLGVIQIAGHVQDLEGWRERIRLVEEEGGVIFETTYQRKDKTIFSVEVSARMLAYGMRTILVATVRDITERKRAEAELERRLAEMEAISYVSTTLRAANTLDEMLPLLLEKTLELLDTHAGSIVLYDPSISSLIPKVPRGWFIEVDQSPMKPDQGVAGYVFTSGEVFHARDFADDPRVRPSARSQIPRDWSIICLPLRTAQETVGVLFAAVQHPRDFTDDEVRLLKTLAEIAGNAIHRAGLNDQTQRNLRRLAALHAIDLAITSSFDLQVSLNILLEQTLFHLEADAAVITRLNPSLQILEYIAGRGLYVPLSKTQARLGESYAGQVALERNAVSVPDLTASPIPTPAFLSGEDIRAYHAVPLIAKGHVKGVLEIFHRHPFQPDQEWLSFLQTLGGQAAIALDNADLFTGLQRSNMELTLAYDATIEGWSRALDLRDKETEGHTQRVTEAALRLAEGMGIPREDLIHIRRGALLHDIGKMGIPDQILLKPGPLTEEDWAFMHRHPEYAYEMLAPIEYLHPALDIPYCHHEKWDGTGYPRGLKGEQIPLAARIFAVVDVWDALRSNRPYRASWSEDKVRAYLRDHAGIHFDPNVVEIFLEMLEQHHMTQ